MSISTHITVMLKNNESLGQMYKNYSEKNHNMNLGQSTLSFSYIPSIIL